MQLDDMATPVKDINAQNMKAKSFSGDSALPFGASSLGQ